MYAGGAYAGAEAGAEAASDTESDAGSGAVFAAVVAVAQPRDAQASTANDAWFMPKRYRAPRPALVMGA
jgi:hypothetical protein